MRVIIKGGQIFTGVDSDYLRGHVVVVENGKIEAIVEDTAGSKYFDSNAKIIELEDNMTVLPGLIDCHVHITSSGAADDTKERLDTDATKTLRGASLAKELLDSGFTTVRNMGTENCLDVSLSRAIDEGLVPGSRVIPSGQMLTMTGGHGWSMGREVDGPHDARKGAREQLRAGAKVIKIMATGGVMTPGVEPGSPQLTQEEMAAAVEEAHKAGCKTATHAQGTTGIRNAILAGIDSIEHGIFLDDETIELMLKNSVALIPTLVAPYHIVQGGIDAGIPSYAVKKAERIQERHIESFRMALEAGVKIGMGTDAGTPLNKHGKNALELEKMVQAGMSTMDALLSTTKVAAEILDIHTEVGTLEIGKIADIVVFKGDPLLDITILQDQPVMVIKEGREVV